MNRTIGFRIPGTEEGVQESDRSEASRDSIICYLERILESTGNKITSTCEHNLPFFRKIHVYENFKKYLSKIYNSEPQIWSYFSVIWRCECLHIKVRKLARFSKWETCEKLRADNQTSIEKGTINEAIIETKRAHNKWVTVERLYYVKNVDTAILRPDQVCLLILHGADQFSSGLPHLTTPTKDVRGHYMMVSLIGVLQHAQVNFLSFLTMREDHETGDNHIVEVIHRFLQTETHKVHLPVYYICKWIISLGKTKIGTCYGTFKSKFPGNVPAKIIFSFLPVGHTHENIYQKFSWTSKRI